MNTTLKVLIALILLPMAACGASCVIIPVAGAYRKARVQP